MNESRPVDDPRDEHLGEEHEQVVIAEGLPERPRWSGPPRGIRRADEAGWACLDALAGRTSSLGLGCPAIEEAIREAAGRYLGDAAGLGDSRGDADDALRSRFENWLGESPAIQPDSLELTSSIDQAVERAILHARCRNPDQAYRMITAVGSDHGRTGVCRIASGRPELHDGYGPMMAGFAHVPVGEIDALRAAVDEQTCAVMLSPLDLADAAAPLDAEYLHAVRETCDMQGLALIIDESRIGFGSAGTPLIFSAISDIQADGVILGAGLFGGLPGGIVISSERLTGRPVNDTIPFPLLSSAALATLDQIHDQQLIASLDASCHKLHASIAETVRGFEFVRDLHVTGTIVGIDLDIESSELVKAAARVGLRVEAAGDAAIRLQLPLVLSDSDHEQLLTRIKESLEVIEHTTTDLNV